MPAASVWRTALRPRWLALLGVVVVLCVAFGWLGHWQLDVARSKEHPQRVVTGGSPALLDQVTSPQQVFLTGMQGRPVTVSGTYDAGRQVLVSGKRLGGQDGYWVLTPLRTASGALVPVVRGFAAGSTARAPAAQLAPVTGTVSVRGVLQVPEEGTDSTARPPTGTVVAADTADLVNLWGGPIYNVLVFTSAGSSGVAPGAVALTPVPPAPADSGGGIGLRNAAYAVQWWLFAVFALLLWWRMVRQDTLDQLAAQLAPAEPHDKPTEPKELTTR